MKRIFFVYISFIVVLLSSCIREDQTPVVIPPVKGDVMRPQVGGPTQPFQVWVDLSNNHQSRTRRDAWDLALTQEGEMQVLLNSSMMMAAGVVPNAFDIDKVTREEVESLDLLQKIQVADFTPNSVYIDRPDGQYRLQTSALGKVNPKPEKNPVFLVNMGKEIYEGNVPEGSIQVAGQPRGWMKMRIFSEGENYIIQWAPLDSSSHTEWRIPRSEGKTKFRYLKLQGKIPEFLPDQGVWDICFSVLTNLVNNPEGGYLTSYIFADMALLNLSAGVAAYEVRTPLGQGEKVYSEFDHSKIEIARLRSDDQRVIGSGWRTTTGPNGAEVFQDRFYVLRDAEGFFFKIRFLRMKNPEGQRGFPEFEFQPL